MSTAYKRQFRANPTVNPETGRSITVNGDTYNKLVEKYGKPTRSSPRKSPSKRMSPRKSPSRMSPRKSPMKRMNYESIERPQRMSYVRQSQMKDPFEVLPEDSILKVLYKLPEHQRLEWIAASPKVKHVYEIHF